MVQGVTWKDVAKRFAVTMFVVHKNVPSDGLLSYSICDDIEIAEVVCRPNDSRTLQQVIGKGQWSAEREIVHIEIFVNNPTILATAGHTVGLSAAASLPSGYDNLGVCEVEEGKEDLLIEMLVEMETVFQLRLRVDMLSPVFGVLQTTRDALIHQGCRSIYALIEGRMLRSMRSQTGACTSSVLLSTNGYADTLTNSESMLQFLERGRASGNIGKGSRLVECWTLYANRLTQPTFTV